MPTIDDDEPADVNVRTRKNHQLERWKGNNSKPAAYKRAPKQEKETAGRLTGGRKIPASGAKFRKCDVEVPDLARIECKATQAKSFSVTRAMMQTVAEAGLANNQLPVIEIEFVNQLGVVQEAFCVMPRDDLMLLLNRVANANADPDAAPRLPVKRLERNNGRLAPRKRPG